MKTDVIKPFTMLNIPNSRAGGNRDKASVAEFSFPFLYSMVKSLPKSLAIHLYFSCYDMLFQ